MQAYLLFPHSSVSAVLKFRGLILTHLFTSESTEHLSILSSAGCFISQSSALAFACNGFKNAIPRQTKRKAFVLRSSYHQSDLLLLKQYSLFLLVVSNVLKVLCYRGWNVALNRGFCSQPRQGILWSVKFTAVSFQERTIPCVFGSPGTGIQAAAMWALLKNLFLGMKRLHSSLLS